MTGVTSTLIDCACGCGRFVDPADAVREEAPYGNPDRLWCSKNCLNDGAEQQGAGA